MKCQEVEAHVYEKYYKNFNYIYNSVKFNELNKGKVDRVLYLLLGDNKPKLGICLGQRKNSLFSPFSAPYGNLERIKKSVSAKTYDDAVDALDLYMQNSNYDELRIVLPPLFYDETELSILTNVFYRKNFKITNIDLNYHIDLQEINMVKYIDYLAPNTRRNLKIAFKNNLVVKKCNSDDEIREAYTVIRKNRENKGYPLRMSLEQVLNTIEIVKSDSFIIYKDGVEIASAILFHINTETVQLIYWGDIAEVSEYKPINYLAYELIKFYKNESIRYIDMGPSSENSFPNYGLGDFKESIGCKVSIKYSFCKEYKNS